MKNHWLSLRRKKEFYKRNIAEAAACEKRWKRMEMFSNNCDLIMRSPPLLRDAVIEKIEHGECELTDTQIVIPYEPMTGAWGHDAYIQAMIREEDEKVFRTICAAIEEEERNIDYAI